MFHDQQPHRELGRDASLHLLAHLSLSGSSDLRGPGNGAVTTYLFRPTTRTSGEVTIHENGGIFTAALRPTSNWDINGTSKPCITTTRSLPMGFRQSQHYRMHTIYRPKTWATVSGAFNDLERHNNTNNNQASRATPLPTSGRSIMSIIRASSASAPSCSRTIATGSISITPTAMCTLAPTSASRARLRSCRAAPVCLAPQARAGRFAAPSQHATEPAYVSGRPGTSLTPRRSTARPLHVRCPGKKAHSDLGYRISSVNGSRFFNDARTSTVRWCPRISLPL